MRPVFWLLFACCCGLSCEALPEGLNSNPFLGLPAPEVDGLKVPYVSDGPAPDDITFLGQGAFGVVQRVTFGGQTLALKTLRITPSINDLTPITPSDAKVPEIAKFFMGLDTDPNTNFETIAYDEKYITSVSSMSALKAVEKGFKIVEKKRAELLNEIKINQHLTTKATAGLRVNYKGCYKLSSMSMMLRMDLIAFNAYSETFYLGRLLVWTFFERLAFYADLLEQYMLLHATGVVHCDSKDENFGFDDNERSIILDFGLSTLGTPCVGGSKLTVAPEVAFDTAKQLTGAEVFKSDVYSLGVTFIDFELFVGNMDFASRTENVRAQSLDQHQKTYKKLLELIDAPKTAANPAEPSKPAPALIVTAWKQILTKMIATNPVERISSVDALFEVSMLLVLSRQPANADLAKLKAKIEKEKANLKPLNPGLPARMAATIKRLI